MEMRLTIRAATIADVPAIADLLGGLGYRSAEAEVRGALEAMFQDPRHAVVVAESAEAIVGLLALAARPSLSLGGWIGAMELLVVRPASRRHGVGEALLQYAKGVAAERGLVQLGACVADTDAEGAAPFLLALGFERAGVATFRWSALEAKHPRRRAAVRPAVPALL